MQAACLACVLRHLGYVAIALSLDASTAQTCRLANATPARLRSLLTSNLDNLERVLAFNADREIRLYRISSDVVPFASHSVNRLRWWRSFGPQLGRIGAFIRRHPEDPPEQPGARRSPRLPRRLGAAVGTCWASSRSRRLVPSIA